MWPGCQAKWDAQLEALGYSTADSTAAATVGRTAADAVIAHRANDGANQAGGYADTSGYRPVNPPAPAPLVDPWRWQPQTSAPALRPALAVRAPRSAPTAWPTAQIPSPPKSVPDSVDNMVKESAGLNDRKKSQAVYWSDGPGSETPPGHWNLIAQWLSRRHRQTLDQDATPVLRPQRRPARRQHHLPGRPSTAGTMPGRSRWCGTSRRARRSPPGAGPYLGIGPIQGETWSPYIPTPNFPEYTSGHSTFSTAAAAVLKDFRGAAEFDASATVKKGTSFVEPATATQPGVRGRRR